MSVSEAKIFLEYALSALPYGADDSYSYIIAAQRELDNVDPYVSEYGNSTANKWHRVDTKKHIRIDWIYLILTARKSILVARYKGKKNGRRIFELSNGAKIEDATHYAFLPPKSTAI